MRIGLTYNLKPEGAEGDRFEEFDSLETIEALEGALRANGHEPVRLGWGAEMLDTLERTFVDGVLNIAEGVGGRGRESQVPATLEMLGVPCSGSDPVAIGITLDKGLAKSLAVANGIATAPFNIVVDNTTPHPALRFAQGHPLPASQGEGQQGRKFPFAPRQRGEGARRADEGLRYPLFAKPSCEGSSMGITSASRCATPAELQQAIERLLVYGPVLVEEYLPGDEFTVGIVDSEVVGTMQVAPRASAEHFIYSLEVKRDFRNRVEYRMLRNEAVEGVALDVWRAFGLRDAARVDVRMDRDGVPNFVEVNPLPGVHPDNSDLVILTKGFGWTYEQLIGRIVGAAERRWRAASP